MLQRLKECLEKHGISQAALARAVGISQPGATKLVLHGKFPVRTAQGVLEEKILGFLRERAVPKADLKNLFENTGDTEESGEPQEEIMLLSRQTLLAQTKKHFRLFQDPFNADLQGPEDVFLTAEIRYIREAMFHVARSGGFMALVGESGSGKSTLRRDLIERVDKDSPNVRIIEPYVLGMEDSEERGKRLRSLHIAEAIMDVVAPGEGIPSSAEARFRQLHKVLRDSSRTGQAHCLVIEEAHGLPIATLKHLKRFYELEDGFRRLLSIILIGQPELRHKLAQGNYQVREVVQRCEVLELRPLGEELRSYLEHKLTRAGVKDMASVITDEGVEALRARLTGPVVRNRVRETRSLCYPLAVGNTMTAALNLAAELGVPQVTGDVIRQV